jgi:adenylate cyclase
LRKRRKSWSRFYRLVVVFNLGATAALGLSRPGFLADLRNSVFDRFQRLDPAGFDPDSPVRVAAIDEQSLAALGQWPWPRTRLADLTDRLREMGAAAVGFDVVFAEPDRLNPDLLAALLPKDAETQALADKLARTPSNDSRFARALSKAPSVLGLSFLSSAGSASGAPRMAPKAGFAMAGDDSTTFFPAFAGIAAPLPALADAAAGLGAINWIPDHDQVVRRVPLIARFGDLLFPALSLEALRLASGASTIVARGSNASGQSDFGARTGVNAIKIGDLTIPTDAQGAIRPRFSLSHPRRMISIAALLRGEVAEDEIKGRIVLVGPTAAGLGDIKATPLEAAAPGVEIHAQILEQMLSVAGALIVAGLFGGAFMAFSKSGLLLDPAQPSLSVAWQTLTGLLALWRAEIASRQHIQTAFGKYLSPVVVERLAEQPERLALGGETRELTVMFADLRDFTKLSEGLDAQEVTRLMNAFLTPMTEAILMAEGTIDKYIGDAIMAFWNAPLDVADHPRRAVAAALAMRGALEELNRARRQNADGDVLPLRMGIGLNLGPCSVGNMGSARRFDYSALGDNVNLASRLEGASKAYGVDIIAAQTVADRAPEGAWLDLGGLAVKGRAAPTRDYALVGDATLAATDAFQSWRGAHKDMLAAFHAADFARAARLAGALEASAAPDWRALYRVFKARFAALAEEQRSEAPAALLALDAK